MRKISNPRYAWLLGVILTFTLACSKDHPKVTPPVEQAADNNLTSFGFTKAENPGLWNDITTEIKNDTVYAHTLVGTDISGLIADFKHEGVSVRVDGVEQKSGNTKQDFSHLVKYSIVAENGDQHTYVVKFSDTGMPAVYISTGGQPINSKDNYVEGEIRITKGLNGKLLYEGVMEIKGRGNSTWGMPKKPYRIKLDKKAPLLDMPSNKNWALMANYGDQSLLRNDVAFEVSRRFEMEYTPRQKYVELFLNGEYMGNYNLTEHVKEGKDRVPVDEDNGGYVLEEDGYADQEPSHFRTPKNMPITIKFPDEDDITTDQYNYIKDYVSDFEKSLFSARGTSEGNYQQYFDLPSFVNYYLINEICGNPDMLWSMRMYKKSSQDPKIYVGPVWDFDLGFNNDKRIGKEDAQQKLMLTNAHDPRYWMDEIRKDPAFKQMVRSRWNSIKSSLQTLPEYIDSVDNYIKYSQIPNFKRWDNILGVNINQSWYTAQTHEEYVDFVRDYLTKRIAWLDGVFNGAEFN
ncbi:CotH kinase family protein [Arachidicoccus ginsenosidivorans]|nr:CotH kinase family protein [Arachidicoccus ginsenosidivorans]